MGCDCALGFYAIRPVARVYNRLIWLLFDNQGDCEIIHIGSLRTDGLDKGVFMNLKLRFWISGVALASALALAACGGDNSVGPAAGVGANLNISAAGEALQYAPAALNATAGQPAKVTFKNGSAAQKHNW